MDIDIKGNATETDKRRLIAAAEKGCFVEQSLKPGLVKHRLKVDDTWFLGSGMYPTIKKWNWKTRSDTGF